MRSFIAVAIVALLSCPSASAFAAATGVILVLATTAAPRACIQQGRRLPYLGVSFITLSSFVQ